MRVEDPAATERGGRLERSVRLAWIGGEARLNVTVPVAAAGDPEDLSPFLPAALLIAMRRAEPLWLDGPVSPRLLAATGEIQQMLSAWSPLYRRVELRARAAHPGRPGERPVARAACFSRGIDSMYSAAVPRAAGEALTHLLYAEGLEPVHGPETLRREAARIRGLAERLGYGLLELSTNARAVLDLHLGYEDGYGAALAVLALACAGAVGRVLVPTSMSYPELGPEGSHPLLDPLWSTEDVEVIHDAVGPTREEKVAWLAHERLDLMDEVHVCYRVDGTGNCGRCGKCLRLMVLLAAADALGRTSSVPGRIDRAALRASRGRPLVTRVSWSQAWHALGDGRPELRADVAEIVRGLAEEDPATYGESFIAAHGRAMRAIEQGRVAPPDGGGTATAAVDPDAGAQAVPPRDVPAGRLGLVRTIDLEARRHRYAAGRLPPGIRTAELGALLAERPDGGVPLRLGESGAAGPAAALTWALAPLGWRTTASSGARARNAAARLRDAARARAGGASAPAVPAGWLHGDAGPGRLPLLAARHPVLPDVLLTTDDAEPSRLGYGAPLLLGHLEALAPVTGRLGVGGGRIPPWADWR